MEPGRPARASAPIVANAVGACAWLGTHTAMTWPDAAASPTARRVQ